MKKSVRVWVVLLKYGGELSVLLASGHFLLAKLQSEDNALIKVLCTKQSVERSQAVWLV